MFSEVLLKNRLIFCFNLLVVFQALFLLEVGAQVPPNETTLIFYYGPEFNDSMRYELSEASEILENPNFNKNNKLHLYFHGWRESQASESIAVVVNSYFKRNDINLVTVDWAKAAAQDYLVAALYNVQVLGPVLADSILDLYKAGIDRKDLIVVAHSLGAQLAGITARQVIAKTNNETKIYRVDALDAAYPIFSPAILPYLNKNDAEFLQAIHTDSGTYGTPLYIGHVNFWPNGGVHPQPGCPQDLTPFSQADLCSHQRSWRFWAESVGNVDNSTPKFLGFPADTYLQFLSYGEDNLKNATVEMGINCPVSARGNYYLKTNSETPFAKGLDGY